MSNKRIVVTGIGMLNAVGVNAEQCFENMFAGKSGAKPIRFFDPVNHQTKFACELPVEIDDVVKKHCSKRFIRQTLKFSQYGFTAVKQMLHDYPVDFSSLDRDRIAVPMGVSGAGIYGNSKDTWAIVRCMANSFPAWVSMEYGITGPAFSVSTACSSSADSIVAAWRLIQSGEVDMCLTGGADGCCTSDCINGFNALMALSERNDAPEKASRPFDKHRDGFVMGEGAGVCVIETLEHARRRGATILAELRGVASTSEATNIVAPKDGGAGMILTMKRALKSAGMSISDIDYISAHGTSTKQNDTSEAHAISQLFGDQKVMISSQKSMIGHCVGAAGGLEFVTSVMTVNRDMVTPTINHDEPEDAFRHLDFVPYEGRQTRVRAAMSNSFAFGGHNACLIVSKFEP